GNLTGIPARQQLQERSAAADIDVIAVRTQTEDVRRSATARLWQQQLQHRRRWQRCAGRTAPAGQAAHSWLAALDDPPAGRDLCNVSRTKLVMVTGATSGIGAAVAKAFCASGANVFLLGRNARRLSAAAARLPAARVAGTERVDLGSLAELRSTLTALAQRLRRVDVLVHAAGEYGWTEPGSLDT